MRHILFVHGWPDTEKLWTKQLEYFGNSYHCHTLTLPGFGEEDEAHDFPELVDFIVQKIRAIGSPLILVGHDWGAILSYMVEHEHPELVERIIGLDVGSGGVRTLKDVPLAVIYQSILAGTWIARRKFPKFSGKISKSIATLARAPFREDARPHKNFIYYYFIRNLLIPKYRRHLLLKYTPTCPLLYIYSESKPIMFHSKGWETYLRKRSDCEVVTVRGSHWFMFEKPEIANEIISKWLAK